MISVYSQPSPVPPPLPSKQPVRRRPPPRPVRWAPLAQPVYHLPPPTIFPISTAALGNAGNSCYINATLQCIANVPLIMEAMGQMNLSGHGVLRCHSLLKLMIHCGSTGSRIIPRPLYYLPPTFTSMLQEDAEEYMTTIFRHLVQAGGDSVHDVMSFLTMKSTICSFCNTVTETIENAESTILQVGVPEERNRRVTLRECIAFGYAGGTMIRNRICDTCGNIAAYCPYTYSIAVLPDVLIIQLKRFTEDFSLLKIDTFVQFDTVLNSTSIGASGGNVLYNLVAVIEHQGRTIQSGHYIAKVNTPYGWRLYDDGVVSQLDANMICTRNAYVIFYQRVELVSTL